MTHKYTFSFLSITSDKENALTSYRTSRPCTGHLKAGAGHPRCRTSRPCAGHLKAGAGHPGLAPDISRQVPDISRQVPDIPAKRWTS